MALTFWNHMHGFENKIDLEMSRQLLLLAVFNNFGEEIPLISLNYKQQHPIVW